MPPEIESKIAAYLAATIKAERAYEIDNALATAATVPAQQAQIEELTRSCAVAAEVQATADARAETSLKACQAAETKLAAQEVQLRRQEMEISRLHTSRLGWTLGAAVIGVVSSIFVLKIAA